MADTVLFTRPAYETTTKYLSAWNEQVVDFAKKNNWQVIDLKDEETSSENFNISLKKFHPKLLLLNGHGNYDLITGDNGEILIEAGNNEEVCKNKIVYAFSCETGKILGPAAVEKGAKCYLGYDESFVFLVTEGMENNPIQDTRAKIFMEPALTVSISLLSRKNPKVAHQNSVSAFKKNIQKTLKEGKKSNYLLRYLIFDMNHQVCLE